MAVISPFQAIRYNPDRVNGPLKSVVSPPYDVLSLAQQDELYKRSPHNVVRIILNRQYDGDGPDDNRYTRSARKLNTWLDAGVLAEDAHPAYYVYEQTYTVNAGAQPKKYVRRGVLVALKLEPFGSGKVYPHEETFPSHKADRYSLMQATRANTESIFGLVPDGDNAILNLLAGAAKARKADVEVVDEDNVEHRLWIVEDPGFSEKLGRAFEPRGVFIADGHHRYETACTYCEDRKKNDSRPGDKRPRAYESILIHCVPMSDPGLHILPTHRLIKKDPGFDAAAFLKQCEALFTVKPATDAQLVALAEQTDGPVAFGLVFPDGRRLQITAKPDVEAAMKKAVGEKSAAWRELDVAVLHELLLKGFLGIGAEGSKRKNGIAFTKDATDALKEVTANGPYDFGVVMRPTRIDQVCAVSETGERMPQKSTYFYPKVLSGLVMRKV